jgi:hypothetical protein
MVYACMSSIITYPRHSEHGARRLHAVSVRVLVAQEHHLSDAALDDGLRALVAGKESHVYLQRRRRKRRRRSEEEEEERGQRHQVHILILIYIYICNYV